MAITIKPLLPLVGPQLKVNHAVGHLRTLAHTIDTSIPRNLISKLRYDPDFGPHVMIGAYDLISTSIPLILGDLIHNLRAALDHLACDLVKLNERSDKGVYFPFSASHADLHSAIKAKNFNRAGDRAVEIMKALAPYRGGNNALGV